YPGGGRHHREGCALMPALGLPHSATPSKVSTRDSSRLSLEKAWRVPRTDMVHAGPGKNKSLTVETDRSMFWQLHIEISETFDLARTNRPQRPRSGPPGLEQETQDDDQEVHPAHRDGGCRRGSRPCPGRLRLERTQE